MWLYIGMGVGWVFVTISAIVIQKKLKHSSEPEMKPFNISDRVVKNKKYLSALSERTKPTFK